MEFENSEYLYLLVIIPIILLLFFIGQLWRKKTIKKIGDTVLVAQLMQRFSAKRKLWKLVILCLAFTFLVLGLANLRMGSKREKVQREGSEIMICFDVSRSMNAQDIKPDRITRAKIFTSQLIEKLQGNKVGLVVFAGKAYVQTPLTVDVRASLMYLNTINTDMVQSQGTAIGDAIDVAMQEFKYGGEDGKDEKNKAIIIITDGETHDENTEEMAKKAAEQHIKILTVGVGSQQGAPIPIAADKNTDYKKDADGNIVLTKLNEHMLEELAATGNGSYVNIDEGKQAVQNIYNDVAKLEKTKGQEYEFTEYKNHFQLFLGIGLLLLTIEFFMSDKKPLWVDKVKIFDEK